MSTAVDSSSYEDLLALSPASFSNLLDSESSVASSNVSLSDTWNDDGFIFSLDEMCDTESIDVYDALAQYNFTEPLVAQDIALDLFGADGMHSTSCNPPLSEAPNSLNDIFSGQDCAAPSYMPRAADTFIGGLDLDEFHIHVPPRTLPNPGCVPSEDYNLISPWQNVDESRNAAGECCNTSHAPDGVHSLPDCGLEGIQNNVEEIQELKTLIKQYMEEMRAMREYMREVPATHRELQMTKERCERIGQGLHKFSMDLLKFKGV